MSTLGIIVPVVLTLKQGEVSMEMGKLTSICHIKQQMGYRVHMLERA